MTTEIDWILKVLDIKDGLTQTRLTEDWGFVPFNQIFRRWLNEYFRFCRWWNKLLEPNKIHKGDWIELANQLDDESVDMIMCSPPYWGLRDYGVEGQLGLEPHPDLFIKHLVDGFRILRSKLKKTGSLYLNLGDTYFGSPAGNKDQTKETGEGLFRGRDNLRESNIAKKQVWNAIRSGEPDPKLPERLRGREQFKGEKSNWLQPKQLMFIPSRVAIAMQEDDGSDIYELKEDLTSEEKEFVISRLKSKGLYNSND